MQTMTKFFLTLALLAPVSCSWASSSAQDQQQLHSQTTLLAIDALTYYDTDPRAATPPDESILEALSETRRKLKEVAVKLSLPASLAAPLAGMGASLDELGGLSREQASSYAPLLITLLDNRAQLNRQMDTTYTGQSVSQLARALNRQSLRISEILLHALARNAVVLNQHSMAYHQTGLSAQDQAIEQGFDELKELLPTSEAEQLQHQRLAYRFVRPKLLQPDTLQKAAAAERYITGIVTWLDQQAMRADH
ncbi:hypothetical protein [Pseudomonas sp. 2FG]|uniref:hypothetical protein n=1 Tax=Pseudomonas sp. 2FG TaxID=2502191 RepID=UPI0010F5090A|nr:hypothetical protein [Pseudomonas sp. 2FG]